jgi:hypothetical protein
MVRGAPDQRSEQARGRFVLEPIRNWAGGIGQYRFERADPGVESIEVTPVEEDRVDGERCSGDDASTVAPSRETVEGLRCSRNALLRREREAAYAQPVEEPGRAFQDRARERRQPALNGRSAAVREQLGSMRRGVARDAFPILGFAKHVGRIINGSALVQQRGRGPPHFSTACRVDLRPPSREQEIAE